MNLCTACGQDFGSVSAFDRHRVGVHAYTYSEGCRMDPIREDGRRCLYPWEYEAKGLVPNSRGVWSIASALERARAINPEANKAIIGLVPRPADRPVR